jgi:5'-nucleotidase
LLKDRKIDLVISGINHGSNSSINVIYSGTMSAAIEAAIEGIPAIGFSLCDYSSDANFEHTILYVKTIIKEALTKGLAKNIALNVNFPIFGTEIKGMKICRQAVAKYEEVNEKRTDPIGRDYYWASGKLQNNDHGKDTDESALAEGYISIVPCQFDMTAHHAIAILNSEWNIN